MTTYNTYQEAKISNPNSEIYKLDKQGGFIRSRHSKEEAVTFINYDSKGVKCNPADYCMTLEKFLSDGHKLEIDDVIFGKDEDDVDVVSSDLHCRSFNMPVDADRNIYILRAAALESIPTETPEEKEVMDGIDSSGEVEWSGEGLPPVNIECEWIGGGVAHGDWGPVIVRAYSGDYAWIEKLYDNSMHTVRSPAFFRKPETPQHREDRERLENGKSLHNAASKTEEAISHGIFRLWEMEDKEVRRHYCQLAEIIGYRKDKPHGTN